MVLPLFQLVGVILLVFSRIRIFCLKFATRKMLTFSDCVFEI